MFRYPKLLALGLGLVSATGFAPLELWPVTLAAYALLIALIARAPGWRAAFARGWWFGFGQFSVGLNWIAHAFTYQDAMPHWLGYFAVVALSLYLAVYPGLATLGAWILTRFIRHPRESGNVVVLVLFFAAAWIATEWLRATMFTGFEWNPLGVIWVPLLPVAHASEWVGTYGLSGLTVLVAGGLLALAYRNWRAGAALLLLPVLLVLPHLALQPTHLTETRIRVVQPNVSQDVKQDMSAQTDNLMKLIRMSGPPSPEPRLLLWPEAALDNGFLIQEEPALRARLADLLGPGDALLTGGIALEYDRAGDIIGARNSLFVLAPDGTLRGRYDKAHLVPYGEYLPMRSLLSPLGLARLVPGDLDFWPGPGPRSLSVPGFGLVGAQICYEIIFSGHVVDEAHRPRFLFNPSNDAWFGAWGPPQHLAQARLRAIEEGMPIVRATPNGISAVIDADGRLLASIPHHRAGVIDARLPAAAPPTLFARFGNLLPFALACLLALSAVVTGRARR